MTGLEPWCIWFQSQCFPCLANSESGRLRYTVKGVMHVAGQQTGRSPSCPHISNNTDHLTVWDRAADQEARVCLDLSCTWLLLWSQGASKPTMKVSLVDFRLARPPRDKDRSLS